MNLRLLKKDFQRKKSTTCLIILGIALSTFFIAAGFFITTTLVKSIDDLFSLAKVPDVVQMHKGTINKTQISDTANESGMVKAMQIQKMLTIDGTNLKIDGHVQTNSVMDVSFVKQNRTFDFLLNMDNKPAEVTKNHIGVPIYYYERYQLNIGEKILLKMDGKEVEFIISEFIRDGQMNPSSVSSKRFLISEHDYDLIEKETKEFEYLIEFQLKNRKDVGAFQTLYAEKNLPQQGPMVDWNTFKLLNGLSDGLVALLIVFISLLLISVAMLALRFTFSITLEEDMEEIGALKAIGVNHKNIKQIYLVKYMIITLIGSLLGYLLSIGTSDYFIGNMTLYLGKPQSTMLSYLIPFSSILFVLLIIYLFCQSMLKRIKKISAVDALKQLSTKKKKRFLLRLSNHRIFNLHVFLGLKDVFETFSSYLFLITLFIIGTFIITIPLNIYNTMNSSSFISYMGVGKSDIRIDLQTVNQMSETYTQISDTLRKDREIETYEGYPTYRLKIQNDEKNWETINVEGISSQKFPLTYLEGKSPVNDNEIALSYLNSQEYDVKVGDTLHLKSDAGDITCKVTGIYQDITNGGKSAKGNIDGSSKELMWYMINIKLRSGADKEQKINELAREFNNAKITDMDEYMHQTLGDTVKQIRLMTILATIISALLTVLLSMLFMRLLLVRNERENGIKLALGTTTKELTIQFLSGILCASLIGIILGVILSNTIGASLVSLLSSSFGMPSINFTILPLQIYVLIPIFLVFIAVSATKICLYFSFKEKQIVDRIKN